jgi:hypothetical protein
MSRINLAPRLNKHAPDTAKIVTDQESKVTNELGIATTPHAHVRPRASNKGSRFPSAIFSEIAPVRRNVYSVSAIAVSNQGIGE